MNLPDINPNLPCLRHLAYARRQNRHMSCITSIPILIQLCIYPDEKYAHRTMRILFSSCSRYSPNVCDEFGCNVLMYSLRYERYKLFEFLLKETTLDLNLCATDRQGNTILHYAIVYGGKDTQIIDRLIEKYHKYGIEIDQRNTFGFTPLLLAAFCGRYDLALVLLTKTNASPFVRDYIQLKNIFDYIQIYVKPRELISRFQNSQPSPRLTRNSKHQKFPLRREIQLQTTQHQTHKNFFETILPQAVHGQSGFIHSSIIKMFDLVYVSSNLTNLLNYLNRRYPQVKTLQQQDGLSDITKSTQENSKTNVHSMLQIHDPHIRAKAIPPKPLVQPSKIGTSTTKTRITFRRLANKITTLAAFSRSNVEKKLASVEASNTD